MLKFLIAALILLLLFSGRKHIARLKSAKSLNLVDHILGHHAAVRLLQRDQPYGHGPRQQMDIWGPAGDQRDLPIILYFYGGGWESGARGDYAFVGRALAEAGFITFIPDYRLAPQAHFPDFLEDCASAAAWVQQHAAAYGGHPRRIALMGHSAGAYIAAMLALDPQWLRRAGGDAEQICGVAGLAGPYDFLPLERGGQADRAMGRYRPLENTQPIHFAHHAAPPFWLASGSNDIVVKPRNSFALAEALQAKGAAAEMQIYDGLNHADVVMALSKPFRNKANILQDATKFLHRVTNLDVIGDRN